MGVGLEKQSWARHTGQRRSCLTETVVTQGLCRHLECGPPGFVQGDLPQRLQPPCEQDCAASAAAALRAQLDVTRVPASQPVSSPDRKSAVQRLAGTDRGRGLARRGKRRREENGRRAGKAELGKAHWAKALVSDGNCGTQRRPRSSGPGSLPPRQRVLLSTCQLSSPVVGTCVQRLQPPCEQDCAASAAAALRAQLDVTRVPASHPVSSTDRKSAVQRLGETSPGGRALRRRGCLRLAPTGDEAWRGEARGVEKRMGVGLEKQSWARHTGQRRSCLTETVVTQGLCRHLECGPPGFVQGDLPQRLQPPCEQDCAASAAAALRAQLDVTRVPASHPVSSTDRKSAVQRLGETSPGGRALRRRGCLRLAPTGDEAWRGEARGVEKRMGVGLEKQSWARHTGQRRSCLTETVVTQGLCRHLECGPPGFVQGDLPQRLQPPCEQDCAASAAAALRAQLDVTRVPASHPVSSTDRKSAVQRLGETSPAGTDRGRGLARRGKRRREENGRRAGKAELGKAHWAKALVSDGNCGTQRRPRSSGPGSLPPRQRVLLSTCQLSSPVVGACVQRLQPPCEQDCAASAAAALRAQLDVTRVPASQPVSSPDRKSAVQRLGETSPGGRALRRRGCLRLAPTGDEAWRGEARGVEKRMGVGLEKQSWARHTGQRRSCLTETVVTQGLCRHLECGPPGFVQGDLPVSRLSVCAVVCLRLLCSFGCPEPGCPVRRARAGVSRPVGKREQPGPRASRVSGVGSFPQARQLLGCGLPVQRDPLYSGRVAAFVLWPPLKAFGVPRLPCTPHSLARPSLTLFSPAPG
ncbi:uncharacterized protein LOC135175332 isoform X10 [Pogoniulus pusillus]|uniref:uncharacterized protein LOC135175332 isoform X10 n=1 Tax=Pogoniulus pusillus TaxID=488313 RepID=UPI0030B95863